MYDVITIGSATRDVFLMSRAMHPHKAKDVLTHIEACFPFGAKINVDELHFDTGGGGTNNAATFARLGKFRVATVTRVGNDNTGKEILSVLDTECVYKNFVQIAKAEHTAYSTILSPGGEVGERTILVYRGASEKFEHTKIPWNKLRAKWFYVSSLGGDISLLKKILAHARRIKAQVAFNPGGQELSKFSPPLKVRPASPAKRGEGGWEGLRQSLAFLILNREEAAKLTGIKLENTKELLRALAKIVPSAIMTDGPKGAYAVMSSQSTVHSSQKKGSQKSTYYLLHPTYSAFYVPSVGHKPKNITGAGDAFGSGFLTGWIKSHGDTKEALRVAAINADSVVQHIGAKVGILSKYPSTTQLNKLPIREIKL
ncbi:hypothetical protein A3H11_00785 [Candidatus Uhrbacteria bacterium RIFCSPLOWO2_12_FULL_47_10]|nr:MAG: hypothetical protein A3H11_00785 [Candidatus Uhrbacteria bacterium RIFCSPLOWO2_12_FULL_47_10]